MSLPQNRFDLIQNRNVVAGWPWWASRWLGYRATPQPKSPDYVMWLWQWIGAFCGISLIQAVFGHTSYFIARGVPSIIGSYGASAVLIYGSMDSPLAQPRALFGGHFFSALTGIIITKLVHLLPTEKKFEQLQWLAGSLSCATAAVVMQITGTVHPPAGATALLAAVDEGVRQMGWYYLPVILLSSALALPVALLLNNIQRRYPVYWFTPLVPVPVSPPITRAHYDSKVALDESGQSTTIADRSAGNVKHSPEDNGSAV